MAYTELAAQITGDNWTAKEMNTYVKDNFAAGVPDIFTTKGDIAAASAANAASRVAIGSDAAILMADSNQTAGVVWSILGRYAGVGNAAVNSQAAQTWTQTTQFTEVWDSASAGSSATFTAPHLGYYFVSGKLTFTGSASNLALLSVALYKNGVIYSILRSEFFDGIVDPDANWYYTIEGSDIVSLATGDTLKLYYLTTWGGGTLNRSYVAVYNHFIVHPLI